MRTDEARILLGFPPNFCPTPSQVKEAYMRKVWESHPDLFPVHEKSCAECKFKLISEAYTCLRSGNGCCTGARRDCSDAASYTQVVRTGVARAHGGKRNQALIRVPFLFIVAGTLALGGFNATRAYRKQKEAYPSHNPFLP